MKSADGRDRIFGDNGNDWIVGGTDCDWLFGGFGDDLLNLDDFLETDGGTNLRPETDARFNDGDFAFGGAGRDVLIANTGNDRMFDWHGEFNSYYAPFPHVGTPTVNRRFSPDAREIHRAALADAAGADAALALLEPFDEIALVEPDDGALYQAQTGGPRDPQNIHGDGPRDTQGAPKLECRCDATAIVDIAKALYTADGTLVDVDTDAGDPVPTIPAGTAVFWRYTVRNLSIGTTQSPNVAAADHEVARRQRNAVGPDRRLHAAAPLGRHRRRRPARPERDVGVHVRRRRGRLRTAPGIHTNTVTVEVVTPGGCCAADTAQNRFVTPPPAPPVVQITIVKRVKGIDANVAASGPSLTPGRR